jgi:cardiolipin synthase A/B
VELRLIFFGGADGDERSRLSNLEAAIAVNHRIGAEHDLRGRARVHLYSTRSHAKLLARSDVKREKLLRSI